MNEADDNEIVQVPVPRKHLKVVYQALARAMTEQNQQSSTKGSTEMTTSSLPRSGTLHLQNRKGIKWTAANLRTLREGIRTAAPIKMFDMTAEKPGFPVYFEDVQRALRQEKKQTRGQISTITKVIMRDFKVPYEDANWPVEIKWDTENGLMYYVMSVEVAEAWLESASV